VDGGGAFSAATGTNAWSFNWTPNSPGPVTIKSRAVDNAGNVQNPPAEIHVTVDAPPTSAITSPKEGATVLIGTQVAITGTASDPGGGTVVRVEVSVDGGLNYSTATGTNAWSFNWMPNSPGPVTIKSRAVDNTGNVQNPPAEIHVTVDAPPISTITSPTVGMIVKVGIQFTITGTASDPGGGTVDKVEVSVDGGLNYSTATGTTAWSFDWTPSDPGPVTIKSRAVDNTGNVQNPPAEVHVTVDAPPVSTISSPTEGAIEPAGIPVGINGTASDPGGGTVDKVEVSVDGGLNYSTALGTNDWSFSFTPSTPGLVTIKSRAVDNTGNVQDPPAEVHVTVDAPPQVVSTTPAPGSTNASIGVAPAATFSEALDETTLDATTVLMTDAANNPVPVTISYDASTFTVTLTPQQLLQRGQTYTVTFKGLPDEPHITDATGTPLAADFVWSFTTAFSIFAPTEGPVPPDANEPGVAVELGVKFRSDREGLITGVRFYKVGPANSGEHVGHLWTRTGTPLSSVTFVNETGSGWQQAIFDNPIPIAADTTYVVSYFAPLGNYAATLGQFALSGVDNPPLHALMNGVDGGNGVFHNGGGFPDGTFNSANYWVDVVFNDSGPLPPQVLSVMPGRDATNVSTDIVPAATFSEPLGTGSVNELTVLLTDAANNQVPVTISYESSDFKVTITPQQPLELGQTYTVTLKGGPDEPHITDATGTPLAADYTWSFTTESPPAPAQVTMLSNWVTAGGNFIATRPDKYLAYSLGISDESSVRSVAYLQVDTTREPGAGAVIKRLTAKLVRLP
jgi:hypothetical protein